MSEPIKLPPIPPEWKGLWDNGAPRYCTEHMQVYATLAVEQNTAELRAEVERLRAELSATTERLENRAGTVYALCAETVRLEAERDEARAKVESLRNALEAALDRIPHQCEGLDYAEADCPACQVKALAEEPTK